LKYQLISAWCGLSFLPASLTGVLKTGPFAWDGFLSYYFPYFAGYAGSRSPAFT
jgi:hypothetical protein